MDAKSKKRFKKRVSQELGWNKKLIKTMLDFYQVSSLERSKFKLRTKLAEEQIVNNYWRLLKKIKTNPLVEVGDVSLFLSQLQARKKGILFEGAQATLLDIAHGTYPFVTSSNTITAGVCSGLGVAPSNVGNVFGIFKAYCTRVGSGPFPTELMDKDGESLRKVGNEFGSTTGRPRRCGWLDLPALKYSIMLNGIDQLFMMKADVLSLFHELNVCTHYEFENKLIDHIPFEMSDDLIKPHYKTLQGWESKIDDITKQENIPGNLNAYISFIEKTVMTPVNIVSVGPDREQTIKLTK